MKSLDKYITKEGERYFLDLDRADIAQDITWAEGDLIRFTFEGSTKFGKLLQVEENFFEIRIQKA